MVVGTTDTWRISKGAEENQGEGAELFEEEKMQAWLVYQFSGGEKAGDVNWARADTRVALFYKELLSQARQLAWGLDNWLHCGVWEADEGAVQGPLWGHSRHNMYSSSGTTGPFVNRPQSPATWTSE